MYCLFTYSFFLQEPEAIIKEFASKLEIGKDPEVSATTTKPATNSSNSSSDESATLSTTPPSNHTDSTQSTNNTAAPSLANTITPSGASAAPSTPVAPAAVTTSNDNHNMATPSKAASFNMIVSRVGLLLPLSPLLSSLFSASSPILTLTSIEYTKERSSTTIGLA